MKAKNYCGKYETIPVYKSDRAIFQRQVLFLLSHKIFIKDPTVKFIWDIQTVAYRKIINIFLFAST